MPVDFATVTLPDPTGGVGIVGFICNVAVYTFEIAVAASVVAFLLGAFYYLTSGGNSARVEQGKKTFLYAAAGAVVVILAWGAANILATSIGGTVTLAGCPTN